MTKIIFHIDVNSAYLSWSAVYSLQHGGTLDYRTVPSVVGGNEENRHGIVLAKSIPAKKYRIMTGESLASARKKCPNLLVIPPDYKYFMKSSNSMMRLIYEYSPIIQRYSIDESFVDMSHYKDNYMEIAMELSNRIKKELGFTVNIGISENKLLAKMGSELEKPDKVHRLFKTDLPIKLWPLPVRNLFFVGRKTEEKLNSRGIYTIGDLANCEREYIKNWLKKPGEQIWEFANGIENSNVKDYKSPVKSMGNSTTIAFDVDNRDEAKKVILGLCEMVGMRLREANFRGYVIAISIKDSELVSYRRQKKLDAPTCNTNTIFYCAMLLFDELWNKKALRQISVRMSDLVDNFSYQFTMFQAYDEKAERLDRAIDDIRRIHGNGAIHRACFLDSRISPVIGGVMEDEEYIMMSSEL